MRIEHKKFSQGQQFLRHSIIACHYCYFFSFLFCFFLLSLNPPHSNTAALSPQALLNDKSQTEVGESNDSEI